MWVYASVYAMQYGETCLTQWFSWVDELGQETAWVIETLTSEDFKKFKELYDSGSWVLSHSAMRRKGRPYLKVSFGEVPFIARLYFPLDEWYTSGEEAGEKLRAGTALILVLTSHPSEKCFKIDKKGVHVAVPPEDLVMLSIQYSREEEAFYKAWKIMFSKKRH